MTISLRYHGRGFVALIVAHAGENAFRRVPMPAHGDGHRRTTEEVHLLELE